jgi:hypothetical protein
VGELEALERFGDGLRDDDCRFPFASCETGCLSCFSCFKRVEPSTYCPGCSTPLMEMVFVLQIVQLHMTGGMVNLVKEKRGKEQQLF